MSKRSHQSRHMPKRHFSPLLVGDPSPLPPTPTLPASRPQPISDATLDSLNTRQLIQLALSMNIDPKLVCGVSSCTEHGGHTPLRNSRTLWVAFKPDFANSQSYVKYTNGLDIVYCRGCFAWWRMTTPVQQETDTGTTATTGTTGTTGTTSANGVQV